MSPEIRLRLVPLLLSGLLPACGGDSGPSPTTGAIQVLVSPSASPFDPDGFAVRVDGGADRPVVPAEDLLLEDLSAGVHSVAMTDVDEPCRVMDDNPQSITVVAGDTVLAFFHTLCINSGEIAITTTTTGEDLDPDGYQVSLDGPDGLPIDANGTLTFADVDAGDHDVTLAGIASNCVVQGGSATKPVTVTAWEIARVEFEVVCTAIT